MFNGEGKFLGITGTAMQDVLLICVGAVVLIFLFKNIRIALESYWNSTIRRFEITQENLRRGANSGADKKVLPIKTDGAASKKQSE